MGNSRKILLLNTNLVKPPVAPIAFDYIGSALADNGFETELLDLNFSGDIKGDLRKQLQESYLAIAATIRNTDDCYYLSRDNFLVKIKDIIGHIREYSAAPVILGGGGFSVMPLEITRYLGADFGIAGDGESALPGLAEAIYKNTTASTGRPRILKSRCGSLEKYPLSSREIVDNKRYFDRGGMGSVETKRGCNQRCIYCADPLIKGKRLRVRPVRTVLEEIKKLLSKGIDYIHFCDSEFNIPICHARELLGQIIDKRLGDKIKWYSYMSPVPFDEDFIRLIKKSGCEGINFGIDSAHKTILGNLNRDHNIGDLENISRLCSKYRIKFMFDLLIGGPGEDRHTIKYTIDAVKRLNPTCVGISYGIRVYPGTAIADRAAVDATDFLRPIFFISDKMGEDIIGYTNMLVSDDKRFFIGACDKNKKNYNYNENLILQKAIISGHRGAYWDILQRLR